MLALIGLQLLTMMVAYWGDDGPFAAERFGSDIDTDDGIRCPDCGAENGVQYRFCRRCIAELPGTYHSGGSSAPPLGRGSR